MGSKALIGGTAAIVLGLIIWKGYGENMLKGDYTLANLRLAVYRSGRSRTRRRLTAFYAADIDGNGELMGTISLRNGRIGVHPRCRA